MQALCSLGVEETGVRPALSRAHRSCGAKKVSRPVSAYCAFGKAQNKLRTSVAAVINEWIFYQYQV
jgi:hypothetical protein